MALSCSLIPKLMHYFLIYRSDRSDSSLYSVSAKFISWLFRDTTRLTVVYHYLVNLYLIIIILFNQAISDHCLWRIIRRAKTMMQYNITFALFASTF